MTAALRLVGGDEIIEPFLLENTDGSILDLGTVSLSGGVWWRGKQRIPLAIGSGITVNNEHPDRAAEAVDQVAHGIVTLSEDLTRDIPHGQIASIRLVAVSGDGVTMSSYKAPLERIS